MWIWHEIVRSRVSILLFPVIFWKYLETNMKTAIWLIYCILRNYFYGLLNHARRGSDPFWFFCCCFFFLLMAHFSMFLLLSFRLVLFIRPVSFRVILQTAVDTCWLCYHRTYRTTYFRRKCFSYSSQRWAVPQVSTCSLDTAHVDIFVACAFIVTMTRSVWLFLYSEWVIPLPYQTLCSDRSNMASCVFERGRISRSCRQATRRSSERLCFLCSLTRKCKSQNQEH